MLLKYVVKLTTNSLEPGSPTLPALPLACIYTLRLEGIKVTITCNPPFRTSYFVGFKSVPLPATFVATIIYLISIMS